MSTVTHMISIVVNDQLKIFKIFDILCFPLFPYMMMTQKVSQMRDTSEKVEKKYWFRVRGAHIKVTTLERKAYFFWKVEDLSCGLQGILPGVGLVESVKTYVFWQKKVCLERNTREKNKKK